MKDEYRSIKKASHGLFKDRGSKFIAMAFPVHSEESVKEKLEEVKKKYHDARHHCYAYRLGPGDDKWRVNDDGEPSGTAGNPIMGQIRSYRLNNTLIIVTRYFGGTLLGTGGLINAYRQAAKAALENASIIKKTIECSYLLNFPYASMNDVMRFIKEYKLRQSEQFFELDCSITIHFRSSKEESIVEKLALIEKLDFKKVND
ncbi:MAG: YigZ family protein [Bacteroidales bacterium]|nr:YigZ family protein [Bacteroidales bacterium]